MKLWCNRILCWLQLQCHWTGPPLQHPIVPSATVHAVHSLLIWWSLNKHTVCWLQLWFRRLRSRRHAPSGYALNGISWTQNQRELAQRFEDRNTLKWATQSFVFVIRAYDDDDDGEQHQWLLRVCNPHRHWVNVKTQIEVNTMEMVSKHCPNIPLPTIIDDSFRNIHAQNECAFQCILFEFIHGTTMNEKALNEAQKLKIWKQLASIVESLRSIPVSIVEDPFKIGSCFRMKPENKANKETKIPLRTFSSVSGSILRGTLKQWGAPQRPSMSLMCSLSRESSGALTDWLLNMSSHYMDE